MTKLEKVSLSFLVSGMIITFMLMGVWLAAGINIWPWGIRTGIFLILLAFFVIGVGKIFGFSGIKDETTQ